MLDPSLDGTISSARIAEMLAPTLGWEKSSEVVGEVILRLELPSETLSMEQTVVLLGDLARMPGMVGIAARFARSRLDPPRAKPRSTAVVSASTPPSTRGARERAGPETHPPSSRKSDATVSAEEIASLLASAMGTEKAMEVVLGAARRLAITPERIDKERAMALLDQLAGQPGIVGLSARFTKARLILRFAA
jgi:hypothetical protein